MRAYREFFTVEDPQHIVVQPPVPLRKGQRIELVFMLEDDITTEDGASSTDNPKSQYGAKRPLVRHEGRLIAGTLPGEPCITDEEVRRQLQLMEW